MKDYVLRCGLFLAVLGLAVAPVLAESGKPDASLSPQGDFLYKSASAPLSDDFLLIFAIGGGQLAEENNEIVVTVVGDQETLAVESFFGVSGLGGSPSHLVLEAFSEFPRIRRAVHKSAAEGQSVSIAISVNGDVVQQSAFDELDGASAAALSLEILPRALQSKAVGPGGVEGGGGPFSLFPECGNGICESDTFPPENCEVCPEDCAPPCNTCGDGWCQFPESCETCEDDCGPCPGCPTDLGNVVVETPLFALSNLGSDCWLDHLQPNRQVIYNRRSTIARRMTVNRVLECDGSITETVVPGTTVFICLDCWQRTEEQCNGPMDWIPPCTL